MFQIRTQSSTSISLTKIPLFNIKYITCSGINVIYLLIYHDRMDGLRTAIVTKCSGLTMCEGFTSLTAVQMGEYYHDVKISSLEYADNYELPYTLSFENNRREEIYFSVRQSKKFRNGTEFVSDVSQFAKKPNKRDAFVGTRDLEIFWCAKLKRTIGNYLFTLENAFKNSEDNQHLM